jgi:hypothetical protein
VNLKAAVFVCLLCGHLGSTGFRVRVVSGGYCIGVAAVAEEPPAPSTNSTLRALVSLSSWPGKPLLRRPLLGAEMSLCGCGSRKLL